jgi:hypothetical protein
MTVHLGQRRFVAAIAQLPPLFLCAAPTAAPEVLQLVKEVLEEFYTDGIDSVDSASLDGDAIVGEFSDRVGVRQVKRYRYRITTAEVSYLAINPQQIQQFSALDFALEFAKQRNCKKGTPCGGSCIAANKKCKQTPAPATQAKIQKAAAALGATQSTLSTATAKKGSKKAASKATAPAPQSSDVKLPANQTQLDKTRNDLIDRVGQPEVEAAEKNLQKVLDKADVFVRVGSASTLEKILGDEFKNSYQLGQDTHQIPQLADKSYLKARSRVEGKTLGIDSKTADGDRPIYGYMGSQNLNGASHNDPARTYGSIAVKLKPEVKDRATFTGSDSFKSGFASALKNDGTPPPPNAASIVPATRHGYDRSSLPKHYPSFYGDDSQDGSFVAAAKRAKSVDDLAPKLAPTGNAYIETQIHGGLKPSDIAELHFSPSGVNDRPTATIAKFAKDNGVALYVNKQKLSDQDLDDLINRSSADPKTQRLKDLASALESGDFNQARNLAKQFDADAKNLKMNTGELDRHLKLLYTETGYDRLPTVGTDADVTKTWEDGGYLMVRGVSAGSGKDKNKYLKQFQAGDYFVGNGIYGNGTYVGHAGKIKGDQVTGYNKRTHQTDAKRAVTGVAKHNYISARSVTMRMALPKDAVVVTQSKLRKDRDLLSNKLKASFDAEKARILTGLNAYQYTAIDEAKYIQQANVFIQNFGSSLIAVDEIKQRKVGRNITESEQRWSLKGIDGAEVELTVFVQKSKSLPTTAAFVDAQGNKKSLRVGSNGNLLPSSRPFLLDDLAEREVLSRNKWSSKPKSGEYDLPDAVRKQITTIEDDYALTRQVLGLDLRDDGSLGRFGVLRGVDMIALDKSYEPKTFGNLLNRSKVVIQKDPLDWTKAKTTGAL